MGVGNRWAISPDVKNTDEAELGGHGGHTPNVDSAATEVSVISSVKSDDILGRKYLRHQEEPVAEAGEKCKAVCSYAERVGCISAQSDLLEEVGTGIGKAKTADKLTSEDDTSNFGPAKFEALEAVIVGGSNR